MEVADKFGVIAKRTEGERTFYLVRTYSTIYSERRGLGPRAFDVHHYGWV